MATSIPVKSDPNASIQPPSYETSQQQVGYPQAPPGSQVTTATIVSAQPGLVSIGTPLLYYGAMPVSITCPHCQAQIQTARDYEPGILTWLFCGGIAVVGCFCGCCLIPFCMNDLQDCRHTCPNCKNYLGVYRRI